MRFACLLALILLISTLAGCGPAAASLTAESGIQLSAADSGRTVTMKVGDHLVVELDANPSTGYTWEIGEADSSIIKQVGETEYKSASATPMPGQGGTQVLRFQAVGSGSTTLKLIYHRPWETGVAPINTFTVQVTVQ